MNMESMRAIKVFSSYARVPKDEALRNELEKHLSSLRRQGKIADWYDREILPGTEWAHEIDAHLNSAHVILLFISPDFMSSDYCQGIEVQRAMERHEAGEARVIPVILHPVDWKDTLFSKLTCLPKNGIAVKKWRNQDDALSQIAREIGRVVNELTKSSPQEDPVMRKDVTTILGENVSEEQREAAKRIIEASRELSLHAKKVNELKRVHNMLHEIELALEPLASAIQLELHRKETKKKEIVDLDGIELFWHQVLLKIENLQDFASEMEFLEEKETPFKINIDSMTGPKWVTDLVSLQNDFESSFEEGAIHKDIDDLSPTFRVIDDLSRTFLDKCRNHLFKIDRRLLKGVDQLDRLSDRILRNTNYG